MPIPNPILDDRSYLQLRDELVRRIPVYAPEWTDHNPGDPGIALIELFAFLGENLLYRFNQIPEAAKLAFLRLLQIPVRPATPARTLAAFTTDRPAGALVPLGSELRAGDLPFRTTTEAYAWPVTALAVAKSIAAAPDETTEPDVAAFAARTIDALNDVAAGQTPAWYTAAPLDATGAGPPVDFTATVDRTLWVAVLKGKADPDPAVYATALNLGFVPDPVSPAMADVAACPGEGTRPPARRVEWQAFHGEYRPKTAEPVFYRVTLDGDTTDGLTREGVVRLRIPPPPAVKPPAQDPDLAGTGDRPPALEDAALAARVLFWLRAFRPPATGAATGPDDTAGGFGSVLDVAANAVEASQVALARPEFLGTGTGQPDQRCRLARRPVVADSLVLQVEEAGNWRTWTEIDGFHAAAPDDRVYTLDREAGEVRFGTRLQGWPPQVGERIRANEYRYGGGAAGNVPAKAVAKLLGVDGVKASNRQKAKGGADAESVEAALARIPGEVRRHDRAVTASDFREIALMTPGADLGRAECLPRFHPPTRTGDRPGVVSVVVWPKDDPKAPNAPAPDRDTLRAVCCWLDARRLVTTELYVIPPTYRKVAVSVGVHVKPGYGTEAVRRWVELILRQYLAPLPPYGPAGGGWPLGRRVYGPELEAAVLQVEGVEYLEGMTLGSLADGATAYTPGTVELEPYEVPELAAVSVTDAAPLALDQLPAPPTTGTAVPVPVVREEC